MLHWMFSLEVGLPAAIAFIATIAILCNSYCCHHFGKHENRGCMPSGHGDIHASREERDSLHASHENKTARGIHLNAPHKDKKDDLDAALRPSKKILAVKAYSTRPFDWSDHPGLVAEAVEHGWSAFAFVYRCSTCSLSLKFWEMSKSSCKHELEPDVTWEASSDSLYMQKLWFNPGQVSTKEDCIFLFQSLQAALPLPGPPLDYLPFPQEGYYEITIVADGSMDARRSSYTENEQLDIMSRHLLSGKWRDSEATDNAKSDSKVEMQLKRNISRNSRLSEALQNLSSHGDSVFFPNKHPSKENLQTLAIGLGIGGALPLRLPGLNHGSIGFHSNGRIYLNGVHIDKEPTVSVADCVWGAINTTVGCGFDPCSRNVFFTVDGERVYDVLASTNDFGHPLFPTVAANYNVALLVNFGQNPFEYTHANSLRIPDPGIHKVHTWYGNARGDISNEDSGDLFSMGRMDSQRFTETQPQGLLDIRHKYTSSEADSDLFEIVLDPQVWKKKTRSQKSMLQTHAI